MSHLDDLYEEAMIDWARREGEREVKVAGFRDSMDEILDWLTYCAYYKPIPYGEYLKWIVRSANGELPPPQQ